MDGRSMHLQRREDEVDAASGECVCKAGYKTILPTPTKMKNKRAVEPVCVPICKEDQSFTNGQCICQGENKQVDAETGECVCKPGYRPTRLQVKRALIARAWEEKCVPICRPSQTFKDGVCICNDENMVVSQINDECVCKEGFAPINVVDLRMAKRLSSACYEVKPTCSDPLKIWDDGIQRCTCMEGYKFSSATSDVCVPISTTPDPQCKPGQSYKIDKCVCDDEYADMDGQGNCVCRTGYAAVNGGSCTATQSPKPDDKVYDNDNTDKDYQPTPQEPGYDENKNQYSKPTDKDSYTTTPALKCPRDAYLSSSKDSCICNCPNSSWKSSSNTCECNSGYSTKGNTCVKDDEEKKYDSYSTEAQKQDGGQEYAPTEIN